MQEFPPEISQVVLGDGELGSALSADTRLPLISATGSTVMGRAVAERVAVRLGRALLELGGNNAMIVAPSARKELALRAIVFSAVGTAGQRCTSLRRLIVHRTRLDEFSAELTQVYQRLKVGNPFDPAVHVGPLVGPAALEAMRATIARAEGEGGTLLCGGETVKRDGLFGCYVEPALVQMPSQTRVMHSECFAPLLFIVPYDDFEEAVAMQNGVPQGLSSCLFSDDMREAERFLSVVGSDCGIANINIGTSGAEIGGAFGGEKDTGGGRESGSDSWKNYMRRATNTINYGNALPLAQGIELLGPFDV
jgi:aldehyde dehydrogenase (NAD+)